MPRYPREQMHRVKYTKLTPDQITGKLAAANGPTSAAPLADVFAGKSLKIVLDGAPALSYVVEPVVLTVVLVAAEPQFERPR